MDEKILIVDDDKVILDGFAKLLTKKGYNITTSESGEKAIEYIKNESFDLVLTDIALKGMDGISVLKEVKKHSPNSLVIMITGFASTETAVEALQLGAVDYIIKPCEGDELKYRIENAFEKRRLYQEIVRKDTQLVMHDLTRGLADILNNRMTTVQGFVEFGITCFEKGNHGEGMKSILKSYESMMRVNEITEKLLQFTYWSKPEEKETINFIEIFNELEKKYSDLKLEYHFEEKVPSLLLSGNIKELVEEILKNAWEAGADTVQVSSRLDNDNHKFMLSVSDNGSGIDEKEISKVFIPFYKTKATAHAGLGLWKLYQAVTANKGEVDIESEVGKGTTVTVTLPLE